MTQGTTEGSMERFFEEHQYTKNKVRLYEKIFGEDFVCVGGKDTTEEFCKLLKLEHGDKVLDVGCGIGGSAFHLSKTYGAEVKGFDLLPIMIEMAEEKKNERNISKVSFEVADATKVSFGPESFDVIYSRDTILHIKDKESLFNKFYKWLKPGGQLLISDYCCGPQEKLSEDFNKYVEQRGYTLLTVDQYGKVLKKVGFVEVNATPKSELFYEILKQEVNRFESQRDDLLKEFPAGEFNAIVDGWRSKMKQCESGNHQWGLFTAKKN